MMRRLSLLAGVIIIVPLAFLVLMVALVCSTAIELGAAIARSTQWSPE